METLIALESQIGIVGISALLHSAWLQYCAWCIDWTNCASVADVRWCVDAVSMTLLGWTANTVLGARCSVHEANCDLRDRCGWEYRSLGRGKGLPGLLSGQEESLTASLTNWICRGVCMWCVGAMRNIFTMLHPRGLPPTVLASDPSQDPTYHLRGCIFYARTWSIWSAARLNKIIHNSIERLLESSRRQWPGWEG